jgi:aryl-alcohol dehydrogenase-like predicted oxidoreductase
MQYRDLGKTGLKASAIGLGCAQLGSANTAYAVRVTEKALEMGVTYFDTARAYRDSEVKLGVALKGHRGKVVLVTKVLVKTKAEAWKSIRESLQRLQTDHLDVCHIHSLLDGEDFERRLGPGGSLQALVEAKANGLVTHIGCTSHLSSVLIKALDRYPFEVILVPMNIVEREPLDALIPLCRKRGVGVTAMKPLATGLVPARLALKWLLNQPIAAAVPGATTIEEAEENSRVGHLKRVTLTPAERNQVGGLAAKLDHVRCRICRKCEPCHVDVSIGTVLGTDVMYDHYRTMGPEKFAAFRWSKFAVQKDAEERVKTVAQIKACDDCGKCEPKCSYGLPIVRMLRSTVPAMEDMLRIYRQVSPTLAA